MVSRSPALRSLEYGPGTSPRLGFDTIGLLQGVIFHSGHAYLATEGLKNYN